MKWQYLVGSCMVGIVALAAALVVRGNRMEAQETKAAVYAQPAAKPVSDYRPKASKEQTATELVAIIQETESQETFLVSLMALVALDPKDTSVLPIAIRKAEKLDLLKGFMCSEQIRPGQEMLMQLFEVMIGDKLERLMNSSNMSPRQAPPTNACYAPGPVAVPLNFPLPETFVGGGLAPSANCPPPSALPAPPVPSNRLKRVMPPPQPLPPQSN